MPNNRFDKALGVARGVKALWNPQGGSTARESGQSTGIPSDTKELVSRYQEKLQSKKRELRRIQKGLRAAKNRAELIEHKRKRKRTQQEIFRLESKLRAAESGVVGEPVTGALPDFAVIGARKAGTTYLYDLVTRHPLVEPAAVKEVHYFDNLIEVEAPRWYRQCFPKPRYEDGRSTITGEATPDYLAHPLAPERMARMVPEARLIVLLRNPVERAYSDYQHVARRGQEPLPFEEAIKLEEAAMAGSKAPRSANPSGTGGETTEGADRRGYLHRGIYVDQLLRWRRFFPEERMLVLKSEDLFMRTPEVLRLVLGYLELPEWELETREKTGEKRNEGDYKRGIDPATRRRLERFFEPHNQRLYEYLGTNFGW
ncbi:MAG: sulfotransferase domain-containing protein [Rubrobacter sp.]|nr:sulfotransferase domain-containing protein [Rubrobacter sp.]